MKSIAYSDIVEQIAQTCILACIQLPEDVSASLEKSLAHETTPRARMLLQQCIDNASLAKEHSIPLCQDTGYAVYFVKLGDEVSITGGHLCDAIQEGTAQGYTMGLLRKSIVADPLFDRRNTGNNTPALIHVELVPGDILEITFVPKGGGAENMSALKMLKPSDDVQGVHDFVVDTAIKAGGNPCPPIIVGVGIGGTFEHCAFLAKKALIRPLGSVHKDSRYGALEQRIKNSINASGIGAQGLGGTITALAVHIETSPCHIASLPVAVNINCHVARHKTIYL